ncbi:hypothetical protein C8J57DRAFT_1231751 [Mycena rebaudengoi]|nr:hypothetical protein C8J57DRAFT_1231751 [Mycena rebaudengoi]
MYPVVFTNSEVREPLHEAQDRNTLRGTAPHCETELLIQLEGYRDFFCLGGGRGEGEGEGYVLAKMSLGTYYMSKETFNRTPNNRVRHYEHRMHKTLRLHSWMHKSKSLNHILTQFIHAFEEASNSWRQNVSRVKISGGGFDHIKVLSLPPPWPEKLRLGKSVECKIYPTRKQNRSSGSMSAAQKAEQHRLAVCEHYKKNATAIREKRRLQMAEKAAAKKLKRRQWDPPKKMVPPPILKDVPSDVECPAQSQSVSAPANIFYDSCKASSVTWLKFPLLIEWKQGSSRPKSKIVSGAGNDNDSILEKAMELSTISSTRAAEYPFREVEERQHTMLLQSLRRRHALAEYGMCIVPAPLSLRQRLELEKTGFVGELSQVQAAQIRVFYLNAREFQVPTPEEMKLWVIRRTPPYKMLRNPDLEPVKQTSIRRWTIRVSNSIPLQRRPTI